MCISDQIVHLCGHVWLVVPGKAALQHSSVFPCQAYGLADFQCLSDSALGASSFPLHVFAKHWGPAAVVLQVGGVLNAPGSCASANPPGRLVRLGDIGVTPYAVNWNCKLADWTGQCNGALNLCTYPAEVAGPKNE